jgi:hypothetical protein
MRRCRRAGRRACGITSALCFRSAAEDKKIWLAMYRKRLGAPRPGEGPPPVLFLVHGSSSGAKSSFDLTVPGHGEYSTMNVFARAGWRFSKTCRSATVSLRSVRPTGR